MMTFDRFNVTDLALIERADAFAEAAHAKPRARFPTGQLRKYTNEPYIIHPRAVAKIIMEAGLGAEPVAAALLHDVLEDCDVTVHDLRCNFGEEVTALVIEVTDVAKGVNTGIKDNRANRKAADRARLALASADGQSIKCADLIENTISIVALDPGFAHRYLPEKRAVLEVLTKADAALIEMAYKSLEAGELVIFGATKKHG